MLLEILTGFIAVLIAIIFIIWKAVTSTRDKSQVGSGDSNTNGGSNTNENFSIEDTKEITKYPEFEDDIKDTKLYTELTDIKKKMPYQRHTTSIKPVLHNGQLKLLLSEIEFLDYIANSISDINSPENIDIFIYAGSAPSNKLPFLLSMFPSAKFILVDPNEHFFKFTERESQYSRDYIDHVLYLKVENHADKACPGRTMRLGEGSIPLINVHGLGHVMRNKVGSLVLPKNLGELVATQPQRIFVIEDYFTDELAQYLRTSLSILANDISKGSNVYFISDIRSNSGGESPSDEDIMWNSAMQYNWLSILKPKCFMLKFRCPFGVVQECKPKKYMMDAFNKCPIKFLDNAKKGKFIYIKNDHIWLQAFPGPTSSETRLIGSLGSIATEDTNNLQEYDIDDYNDKMHYYNRIHRTYAFHDVDADFTLGVDHCADCALALHILRNHGGKKTLANILHQIDRTVHNHPHGLFYTPFANTLAKTSKTSKDLTSKTSKDELDDYIMFCYKLQVLKKYFRFPRDAEPCAASLSIKDAELMSVRILFGPLNREQKQYYYDDSSSTSITSGRALDLLDNFDKLNARHFASGTTPLSVTLREDRYPEVDAAISDAVISEICLSKDVAYVVTVSNDGSNDSTIFGRNIFKNLRNTVLLNGLNIDPYLCLFILEYLLIKLKKKVIFITKDKFIGKFPQFSSFTTNDGSVIYMYISNTSVESSL